MGRGKTPAELTKGLAKRLTAARVAAGYESQDEFANALGIGRSRYSKYESGRTPIPAELVQRICEKTGRDANYIYDVQAVPLPAIERRERRQ